MDPQPIPEPPKSEETESTPEAVASDERSEPAELPSTEPIAEDSSVTEVAPTIDSELPAPVAEPNPFAAFAIDEVSAEESAEEPADEQTHEHGPASFAADDAPTEPAFAPLTVGAAATAVGAATANAPTAQPNPAPSLPVLAFSWASLATLLAAWLWWNRAPGPATPDYLPSEATIAGLAGKVINPLDKLGDRMTLKLGETRRIGDVMLTAEAVEHRKIRVLSADGKLGYEPCVLILRLSAKNVSPSKTFAPFDPQFQAMVDKGRGRAPKAIKLRGQTIFEDGYTYSFAHPIGGEYVAKRRLLPLDVDRERGERVAGQEFEIVAPGQTTEGWLVSQEDALPLVTEPFLWRVKIRKGVTSGGAGVAAVVGVRFARSDVQMIDPEPPRVGGG